MGEGEGVRLLLAKEGEAARMLWRRAVGVSLAGLSWASAAA